MKEKDSDPGGGCAPFIWLVVVRRLLPAGDITSATIMTTPSGESRGFGFVNFSETAQAQAACAALNNYVVEEVSVPPKVAQQSRDSLQ